MTAFRTIVLFVLAGLAEIGGAWLVWQGAREGRGLRYTAGGFIALAFYGLVASRQSDNNFGRVLAAYGGFFIAGSLLWGVVVDGFRPNRYDVIGSVIALVGAAVVALAPR